MGSAVLLYIVLAYFALLLSIAFYTSRNSNNESFFIGNRNSKWWVVAFGMIGTSLSGMTFISVPGTVGKSGFDYFQVVIGYWIGYFAVAFILLPIYYNLRLTSIYSYLDKRLGIIAYKTGALFFILSRTLGATLRLYLVIKVLELFVLEDMGIPFEITSVLILALILLYTYRGGVKTIVWTDTLQTTFMLLGLIVCVVYIMNSLHLDLSGTWAAMQEKGYSKMIHTDPLAPNFFLKQILGGAFITIAMTGLDQEMMQKNISVSNLKDSQKNMITFCFTLLVVNFIFLLLGGLLYLYADANGITATGDDLFPTIAVKSGLPFFITVCFLIGLVSALFPSADGALTALTSSFCIDILGMKRRTDWDEKQKARVRLIVHNVMAIIFLGCVFFFREVDNGSLIQTLLVVAGYTYGPLLALFVFGIFTKRKLIDGAIPVVCLLAPIVCYVLKQHDKQWLNGYAIGTELLIINASLTFLLLFLCSKKGNAVELTAD
ncbi:sodium:solute symporter [Polluticoccus soli]|uniref:sodium:solute symporter n=1 Tax=Polluticoccus soli TaxID=3034150 RepID=UPI0023E1BC9A|nr:sodium:solute symporter [Flavipsychrobacter sp. JY13-12]